MLKTTSQEFRTFFLLEFTRELINSFVPPEVLKLNTIIKEEQKEKAQEAKKQIKETLTREISPRVMIPQNKIRYRALPRPLTGEIRIQSLPPRLQYLKPVPREIEMNLGKLLPVLNDPLVRSIECNGPDKNIIVNTPNPQSTNIALTKEEIKNIIQEFSRLSKIPLQEGVYTVAAGKFILLSAISEIVGTKFIIKRIPFQQNIRFKQI